MFERNFSNKHYALSNIFKALHALTVRQILNMNKVTRFLFYSDGSSDFFVYLRISTHCIGYVRRPKYIFTNISVNVIQVAKRYAKLGRTKRIIIIPCSRCRKIGPARSRNDNRFFFVFSTDLSHVYHNFLLFSRVEYRILCFICDGYRLFVRLIVTNNDNNGCVFLSRSNSHAVF